LYVGAQRGALWFFGIAPSGPSLVRLAFRSSLRPDRGAPASSAFDGRFFGSTFRSTKVYINPETVTVSADRFTGPSAGDKDGPLTSPVSARGATVVAMSGGVDSSVAAALLSRENPNVIGVTLRLWSDATEQRGEAVSGQSCTAIEDARSVAEHLNIPHVVLDCAPAFDRHVAQYFTAAYQRGETPNPCVPCNAWRRSCRSRH